MAGLYQRRIAPNMASPAMTVAQSKGAGQAIPRGAGIPQQQDQGIDAAKLGGLLGALGRGRNLDANVVADQAQQQAASASKLPNPDSAAGGGVAFKRAPMTVAGEHGGIQVSALGPGVPDNAAGSGDLGLQGTKAAPLPGMPDMNLSSAPGTLINMANNLPGATAEGAAGLASPGILDSIKNGLGGLLGKFSFGG